MTQTKQKLLKQRKLVEKEQKTLNKVARKQKIHLKNELKRLEREIQHADDVVLTQDQVKNLVNRRVLKLKKEELENLRCCCRNNKYLIIISTICSCAGILWLNNNKENKH